MRTIAFFNNKGGVGKTSLVYHLAWMFHELGLSVLTVDLDPQSNLTSAFFRDDELERFWPDGEHPDTIFGAISQLLNHMGDISPPEPQRIERRLAVLPGDLSLGAFEDRLSHAWRDCAGDDSNTPDAFRVITSFYRISHAAAQSCNAQLVLIDVGPNIGALNRAALVASDYVVVPLGADLFSLQGLRNLGPTLRKWRQGWQERKSRPTVPKGLLLPDGNMMPMGYVLLNPSVRSNRPVKAYEKWARQIPEEYSNEVLGSVLHSDNQLAMIKHFKSLMPLSQEARKPMFLLKPGDGAIGGHGMAVTECYEQFQALAQKIAIAAGTEL